MTYDLDKERFLRSDDATRCRRLIEAGYPNDALFLAYLAGKVVGAAGVATAMAKAARPPG